MVEQKFAEQDIYKNLEGAEKELHDVYFARKKLTPREALDKLENIHKNFGGVPNIPPFLEESPNLWFYRIMETVSHSKKLTKVDVQRMVGMYKWEEVQIQGIGGVNFSILHAAERFPHPEIYRGLKLHLGWVKEKKRKEKPGSHRYASLWEEGERLEKLLKKCQPKLEK